MEDSNLFIAHKRENMFTISVSQLAFPQYKHILKYHVYLAYNSRSLFVIARRSRQGLKVPHTESRTNIERIMAMSLAC